MTTYRPLISIVLLLSIVGCSDDVEFNNAAGAKVIQAERIINTESSVDPSGDAIGSVGTEGQIDPSTGLPVEGGAAVNGGDPVNPDGSGAGNGSAPSAEGTDGPGSGAGTGAGGTAGAGAGAEAGAGAGAGANTGGTSGGTPAGSSPANTIADNVARLKEACATGAKKTIKQSVFFAEVQHCTWSANGNLGKLDGHVQAIEGQRATIELPANAQLCELGIGSVATTIQYDDFMLLTLNNQVLLTSNKDLLVGLKEDQIQAFTWDFSKVRGKAINFNAAPYCLGDSSLCNIPVTDVRGAFQFSIDPASLGKLANNSTNKTNLNFALYATGDNDDKDCWHTAFTLDFTLDYVQ